jgi:acyl-coenzyme A thioesterase PaaI-like protein
LQDRVAEMNAPGEVMAEAADRIAALNASLVRHAAPPEQWLVGKRWELIGRGQTLVPPVSVDHADAQRRSGILTFRAFYHGSGGYVNASAIPLAFVEMMALLAYSAGRPASRMAHLKIDFRAPIHVNTEVRVEARLLRIEGRKIFVEAVLVDGVHELATAEALFVIPRPASA